MICYQGQGFGQNANTSYKAGGLQGHTGIDINCGFGTPIPSPVSGTVYKVLTSSLPANDGSGFTGVFILVDNGYESYELLVGHCNPTVQPGTRVSFGDIIGTEANHGTVFSGGTQITLAMQGAGDQRGAHRHYQLRPYQMVPKTDGLPCLSAYSDSGYAAPYYDGAYYQIWGYDNGFNGCVDPRAAVFQRDLYLGSRGYDVFVLQRFLRVSGYFSVEPTGYFGLLTAAAVRAYQLDQGLTPTIGYFGPKTRASVLPHIPPRPALPIV